MAEIGLDATESIDTDELNTLIRNAFVLDGIRNENILDLCFFIWEADDEDFLVSSFDISSNVLQIEGIGVWLILKILQSAFLDKILSSPFSLGLIIDDEVDPAC